LSVPFCTPAFGTSISERRVAGGNVYSESAGQDGRVILPTVRDFTLTVIGFFPEMDCAVVKCFVVFEGWEKGILLGSIRIGLIR